MLLLSSHNQEVISMSNPLTHSEPCIFSVCSITRSSPESSIERCPSDSHPRPVFWTAASSAAAVSSSLSSQMDSTRTDLERTGGTSSLWLLDRTNRLSFILRRTQR